MDSDSKCRFKLVMKRLSLIDCSFVLPFTNTKPSSTHPAVLCKLTLVVFLDYYCTNVNFTRNLWSTCVLNILLKKILCTNVCSV